MVFRYELKDCGGFYGDNSALRMPPNRSNALWTLPLHLLFLPLHKILVACTSTTKHLSYLRTIFERLSEHRQIVKPAKCQFGLTTIDFPGHQLTKDEAADDSALI